MGRSVALVRSSGVWCRVVLSVGVLWCRALGAVWLSGSRSGVGGSLGRLLSFCRYLGVVGSGRVSGCGVKYKNSNVVGFFGVVM